MIWELVQCADGGTSNCCCRGSDGWRENLFIVLGVKTCLLFFVGNWFIVLGVRCVS